MLFDDPDDTPRSPSFLAALLHAGSAVGEVLFGAPDGERRAPGDLQAGKKARAAPQLSYRRPGAARKGACCAGKR